MKITGKTQIYGIVADPIAHVVTPAILNRIFIEQGRDAMMIPFHITPADFPSFMSFIRIMKNFGGMVVTIPHKSQVASLCDELRGEVSEIGAGNVVHRTPDGKLICAMLDGMGFVAGLRSEGYEVADRSVIMIGAGGAGKAIAFALAGAGVKSLTIVNRTQKNARDLANAVSNNFKNTQVSMEPDWTQVEIVVNCTSLGMKPDDPLPLDVSHLRPEMLIAEIVMNPAETPIMGIARRVGCKVHSGRHMIEQQAHMLVQFMIDGTLST